VGEARGYPPINESSLPLPVKSNSPLDW